MRSTAILAAAACVALLGGCASLTKGNYNTKGSELNGPVLKAPEALVTRIDAAPLDPAPRRELAHVLIANSDTDCENYLVGLSYYRNGYAGGLSGGSLWLNIIAGITTPVRSAHILTAAATGALGTSKVLTDTILGGNEYKIIYSAVKNGREERRRQLFTDITNGYFDTWSSPSIVSYLMTYQYDCGINYALERISEATNELGAKAAADAGTPAEQAASAALSATKAAAAAVKAAGSAQNAAAAQSGAPVVVAPAIVIPLAVAPPVVAPPVVAPPVVAPPVVAPPVVVPLVVPPGAVVAPPAAVVIPPAIVVQPPVVVVPQRIVPGGLSAPNS